MQFLSFDLNTRWLPTLLPRETTVRSKIFVNLQDVPEQNVKLHLICNRGAFDAYNINQLLSQDVLSILSGYQVNQNTPMDSMSELKVLGRILNGIF